MKRLCVAICVLTLFGLQTFAQWPRDEIESYDTLILKTNYISPSVESLSVWLKRRVVGKIPQKTIENLIRQLGDELFENREKAAKDLQSLGFESVKLLQQAAKSPDPEISDRAKKCLLNISPNESPALKAAVIRKLALISPREFLNTLASLDNNTEDIVVLESILDGLLSIPNEVQLSEDIARELLKSRQLTNQIVGAWVMAKTKTDAHSLLDTKSAIVQLNYGYALCRDRNPEGISWIIQSLPGLKAPKAHQAANFLAQLEIFKKILPKIQSKDRNISVIGNDLTNLWMNSKNNFAFPGGPVSFHFPFRILASAMDLNANQGKLWEICADGTTKALFTAPFYINHAIAIDHATFLAGEQGRSLATWTITGDLINRTDPRPNFTSLALDGKGHRFLYSSPEIQELDRDNKSIKTVGAPPETALVARLSDGDFIAATKKGELCLLDGKTPTKILNKWEIMGKFSNLQPIEPTRSGTFLISDPAAGEIREYTRDGKVVTAYPQTVHGNANNSIYQSFLKLPNGNLLVGSRISQNLSEIDTTGNEVKSIPMEGRLRKLFAMPVRMVLPD